MLILPGARAEFEPYLPNSCRFVLNLASMLKNIEKKCGGSSLAVVDAVMMALAAVAELFA